MNTEKPIDGKYQKTEKERMRFYEDNYMQLLKAMLPLFLQCPILCTSLRSFTRKNIRFQRISRLSALMITWQVGKRPSLTTIHQEANLRAKAAIECLEAMRDGAEYKTEIVLPVDLIQRESTRKL